MKWIKYMTIISFIIVGFILLFKNIDFRKDETRKKIKIGAIIPESGGSVAIFGDWMRKGMELGINEFNKEHPQYEGSLEIYFEDSKFEAKEGINAFERLRDIKDVDVFISTMSNISKPILERDPTTKPILLQDVTYPNITDYGNNVFRHFVSSEEEARKLSYFAKNTLSVNSCALIYQNDETGLGAKKVFDELLAASNLEYQSFAIDPKDIAANKSVILKALNQEIECIILFAYSKPWITTMKAIKELGYKRELLTNTAMFIDPWRNAAGESIENTVFTHPLIDTASASGNKFYSTYKSKYSDNPSLEAAYGYDLIEIISLAYVNSIKNSTSFNKELYGLAAFEGAFGRTLIPENRDIVTDVQVSRIINGKIIDISQ